MNKRNFLKSSVLGSIAATPYFQSIRNAVVALDNTPLYEVAANERFWSKIRNGYKLKPEYINLENGYYNIMPQEIMDHYFEHIRSVNYQGSFYMRKQQWDSKDRVTTKLAKLIGAASEEVAITRNTTESLDTIISGYPWSTRDHVIYAHQDYGAMKAQFRHIQDRYGVESTIISVPNHPKSDEEIVDLYASKITPQTKMIHISHMINITGHILPVRKICDMAHSNGIEVLVDGAHCVGHIPVDVQALDCDYYGASLHKWLSAPLGCGILYVKQNKIPQIWPLFADAVADDSEIKKLNHTGTHPVHTDLAIENALTYLDHIGLERKEARLRYLKAYWVDKVRNYPGINVNTPEMARRSCGIANVGIQDMTPKAMADTLLDRYKIWTVAINGAGVHGCRITPNVYTTLKELDTFVMALKEMAG